MYIIICISYVIFHRSNATALQRRLKMVKMGKNRQNWPISEGCSIWSKKDMKNLNTYLKSAKFQVSEKYKLKYFSQVEKIFIFLFFIFHFHSRVFFEIFEVFFHSELSFQRGITVNYMFFAFRGIDQNVWTARTFGIHFSILSRHLVS